MRVFLAGATGVIGRLLAPRLRAEGHVIMGMTRTPERAAALRAEGVEPVVCDVFDGAALIEAVAGFGPDLVLDQLTDLPDDRADLAVGSLRNARIRVEGTHNLIEAARRAGVRRLLAQSVAWTMPPGPGADAVAELERAVLAAHGVVLRYGQFYGPGTYYPDELPPEPRVQIDLAAQRTVEALDEPTGVLTIID